MSTLPVFDRCQETTSTSGTGTISLLGAPTGYATFASTVGDGNQCYYCLADQSGPNWEVGIGTYTLSGSTLSRTTVLASSNSGSLVSFGSNTKTVFNTAPAYLLNQIGSGGGGSGTVTTVSVVSANGFAGTVANATTTPAVTLSTTVTGLLKGNGTAVSAATAGTDYLAPGVTVAQGGTGDTTFTAYAVICGGTTSTGALQQVSGLGSSGNVLTSNGAGALPTWQAVTSVNNSLYSNTATTTVANTSSETTLLPGGIGSLTVPNGLIVKGTVVRIKVMGYWSTLSSSAGNLTINFKAGSTVLATTGAFAVPTSQSSDYFEVEVYMLVADAVASGGLHDEISSQGRFLTQVGATLVADVAGMPNTGGTVINTLTSALNITATWSTASSSNTVTTTLVAIDVVTP